MEWAYLDIAVLCPLVILDNRTEINENSGSKTTAQVSSTGNIFIYLFIYTSFHFEEKVERWSGNSNELFPISTEDRRRENEAKLLWVKNEVSYSKEDDF